MCLVCLYDLSVDAIGQSGVQLFVDAGRPVDSALVTTLVREVLSEKISAMFAERSELERVARQHVTAQPTTHRVSVTAASAKQVVCTANLGIYTWTELLTFSCSIVNDVSIFNNF